jgi:hypothetical protein
MLSTMVLLYVLSGDVGAFICVYVYMFKDAGGRRILTPNSILIQIRIF